MSDIDKAVEAFYGAADSPASPDTGEPDQAQTDDPASRFYKDDEKQAGNPYALEKDVVDQMYGGSDAVQLPEDLDLSPLTAGDPNADTTTLSRNLGYMAAEAGATANDVSALVGMASEHVSGGKVVDDATREQSIHEVLAPYDGDHSKLQDAIDLVATYPELSDWLTQTGAGDDPRIVSKMIELAQTPRGRARLQKFRGMQS
ncbi:hypothetical protein [Halomonas elongata]|uniref:Uncharacterized protein n=1 Tax=Halomonas elongata (strain ATCC 33173 / DSM 2581 / NBRC 15536 / NCIMB 2198 / 1H9) TaxID=768066 RepID=A0ABZ0TCG7_HALED|nr:hypothetical protein [Halomonas elongata]WBF18793.1 hypothetical protein LM502_03545 [Halomonas elongata]WPU47649.1 hypothetical protein SR933_01770 [Halomonas elongata DSM 2581]